MITKDHFRDTDMTEWRKSITKYFKGISTLKVIQSYPAQKTKTDL